VSDSSSRDDETPGPASSAGPSAFRGLMRRNEALIDVLTELQVLDRVPRMGYLLRGLSDPESVAEHNFHVVFLVWSLGRRIPGLDVLRAIEMALIHDLAEVRTGDLPKVSERYFVDGAKHTAERAVLEDLLGPLADPGLDLHDEYRAAATAEARLVKACDKLQLMLKIHVYERWGATGLGEFWDNPDNFPDYGLEAVREVVDELRRRHAEKSR
jgi:putative hydrolase of HD superfamily